MTMFVQCCVSLNSSQPKLDQIEFPKLRAGNFQTYFGRALPRPSEWYGFLPFQGWRSSLWVRWYSCAKRSCPRRWYDRCCFPCFRWQKTADALHTDWCSGAAAFVFSILLRLQSGADFTKLPDWFNQLEKNPYLRFRHRIITPALEKRLILYALSRPFKWGVTWLGLHQWYTSKVFTRLKKPGCCFGEIRPR